MLADPGYNSFVPTTAAPMRQSDTARVRQMLAERSHPATQAVRDLLNTHREAGTLTIEVVRKAEQDLQQITADAYVVPGGRYALELDGAVHFFEAGASKGHGKGWDDTVNEGPWAGFAPLNEIAGPNFYPVRGRRRYEVLEAIAADPVAASARYGMLKQECGVCGTNLTKQESRDRGIGPVCWKKLQGRGG